MEDDTDDPQTSREPGAPPEPATEPKSQAGRFKPGQSGNPGGRPKGSTSFAAAVRIAGDEVRVDKNGNPISIREYVARKLWHLAWEGNMAAMKLLYDVEGRTVITADPITPLSFTLCLEEPPEDGGSNEAPSLDLLH